MEIFLLVLALCVDGFVASIAYGSNQIHIAFKRIALINGICSLCLCGALAFGGILNTWIPEHLAKTVCTVSLLLLGIIKLLDYSIKQYINGHCGVHRDIRFSFSSLSFIIQIYGNPVCADQDQSKELSAKEAVFFALAMSMDSLVAVTLAAFMRIGIGRTAAAAFTVGVLSMYGGQLLGRKLASWGKRDLSWMSGLFFLVLAVTKMI